MGRGRKRLQADKEDVGARAGILPYSAITPYIAEGLAPQEGEAKTIRRAYMLERNFELIQTSKLYGKLFKTAKGLAFGSAGGSVPASAGTTPTVRYVDPFALLECSCAISVWFAAFVERWCTGEEAEPRVLMYHDDVRPGNVHLPEYGHLFFNFLLDSFVLPRVVHE